MQKKMNYLSTTILIFTLFISPFISLSGQTLDVKTITEDSIPIAQVAIELYDMDANRVIAYGLTDKFGQVSLDTKKLGVFLLDVRHLAFETVTQEVKLDSSRAQLVLLLSAKSVAIGEVIVQDKMNIGRINGDTISYNLGAFVDGSEEKLKDVINKLPGLEVTENGKIKANGKIVDNLLIDGKEFFGDNQKTATENLSAEMLEGIELLNNYESFEPIKDIEDSEKTAINIKLKEKYKGRIVGSLELMGGYKAAYQLKSNVLRFTPKFSMSAVFDVNNIAAQVLSFQEYYSMINDSRKDIRNTESTFDLDIALPEFLLPGDHVANRKTKFGAINFAIYPSSKMTINGFSLINSSIARQKIKSEKRLLNVGSFDTRFLTNIDGTTNALLAQSKINFKYSSNRNELLEYAIRYTPGINSQEKVLESQRQGFEDENFQEDSDNRNIVVGQQLSYSRKISRFKLLSFRGYYEYSQNEKKYNIQSNKPLFDYNFTNIYQDRNNPTNEFGCLAKYTQKLEKHVLKVALGYNAKSEKSNINDNLNQSDKYRSLFGQQRPFLNAAIHKKNGFFQYSAKLEAGNLSLDKGDLVTNRLYLSPLLKMKLSFKPTNELSFLFYRRLQPPTFKSLIPIRYIEDYRRLRIGNSSFFNETSLQHVFSIQYLLFDLYHGILFYANSSYTRLKNPIGNSIYNKESYIINTSQIVTPKTNWNTFLNFEMRLSKLKTKMKLQLAHSSLLQSSYIEGLENLTKTSNFTSKLSFLSLGEESRVGFDAGTEYSYHQTNYSLLNEAIVNMEWFPYLELSGKLDKFRFFIKNKFEYYSANNSEIKIHILDAKLTYKKDKSKFKFWIVAHDLLNLNRTSLLEQSSNDTEAEQNIYSRIPGFIGLGGSFEF